MTWYVVCSEHCRYAPDKGRDEAKVWTVSERLDDTGWATGAGTPGYGLTRAKAQFLADAANEKEAREEEAKLGMRTLGTLGRAQEPSPATVYEDRAFMMRLEALRLAMSSDAPSTSMIAERHALFVRLLIGERG